MDRKVQLFIEGQRVELFKDEQISINLSVQQISDLSKTFTDFTQSFSCPASPSNNKLFRHFYNSAVSFFDGTNSTNPNIRRFAIIEIDNTFFRRGSVQLEKANIENNKPYSYTITFYGDLVSLKDLFKELKFIDLDWSSLGFPYEYSEVKNRLTDGATDYNVRYPLISGSRYWQYNNPNTPLDNINTSTGAIAWTELFPAVKLTAILGVIENFFNVTFQGGFLQDEKFTKAYMLFKNKDNIAYISPQVKLLFTEYQQVFGTPQPPPVFAPFDFDEQQGVVSPGSWGATSSTGVIRYNYFQIEGLLGSPNLTDFGTHKIQAIVTNTNPNNVTYYFDITRNGVFDSTIEVNGGGNQTIELWSEDNTNNPSLDTTINFAFRSDIPMTLNVELYYFIEMTIASTTVSVNERRLKTTLSQTDNTNNLATTAPDLKIQDWFSSILTTFNLTCFGVSQNVYEIQTVEEWYNEGSIRDITPYVDIKKIDVSRIKLFNTINFKYQQSESVTNRQFAALFFREYGDLTNAFDYDGGEFNLEVIFENLLFSKFENTNLQVGYNLTEELTPYVPKPILLYQRENENVDFYFTDDDTITDQITTYVPFGQDTNIINEEYSLNFKTEISSFLLTNVEQSLYNVYYKAYLENLYNPKNRQVTVKAILPLSLVTNLKLNDRLTIRTERYIVNNIKLNLTTGEATLVLIQDFRRIIADQVPPIFPPIKPTPNPQCLQQYIPFVNNAVSCTITTTFPGVTITPSTITEPGFIEVCIPANPNSINYLVTETFPVIQIGTENDNSIVLENSSGPQTIILILTWTLQNGNQVSNQIYIVQQ